MKKTIKILLCLSAFIMVLSPSVAALSEEGHYTINGDEIIPIPRAYVYGGSIERIEGVPEAENDYLSRPADLFADENGYLYVADTGNDRVVKLDRDGGLNLLIAEAGGKRLSAPEGVFVTASGDIYVADTGNRRIVKTDSSGAFLQEFLLPKSTLLADVTVYTPTKIAVSSKGLLYILMGEKIMSVNQNNEFLGYIGQTEVGYDFVDAFLRLFASDEQKKNIEKRNATEYTNFTINQKDLIYSVSRDTVEGQIKVLNSVGTNIYRKLSKTASDSRLFEDLVGNMFSGNLLSKPFFYGELAEGRTAVFADVCVDGKGIVTAAQEQNGKLYQYDQSGNLLAVFGGLGSRQGEFSDISAISVDSSGTIYVLDSSVENIQYFSPTAFIKQVQNAVTSYYEGDYQASLDYWQQVVTLNENYPLARYGLANLAEKNEEYIKAMEGYRYIDGRKEYSSAFAAYRYEVIRSNFLLVAFAVIAVFALVVFAAIMCYRRSSDLLYAYEMYEIRSVGIKDSFLLCAGILVRPLRTLDNIRGSRKRIRPYAACAVIAAVYIVRIFFIYTVHYPMQDIKLDEVNLILEFIKLIVPILTWTVCVFLIAGQFSGESTFKENFVAAAYCCVPYVVVNTAAALISHILCWEETRWFALMVNGVMVWMFILLFESVRRLNDFTVGKTIFVCTLSVICMVICWFISLFGYMVVASVLQFAREILQEIQLMLI